MVIPREQRGNDWPALQYKYVYSKRETKEEGVFETNRKLQIACRTAPIAIAQKPHAAAQPRPLS